MISTAPMLVPLMTRRTALQAALALATAAVRPTAALSDEALQPGSIHRHAVSLDGLFIDETIQLSGTLLDWLYAARHTLPVVGVRLDARSHESLQQALSSGRTFLGCSTGATLFCLERMAWEHRLRLTDRRTLPIAQLNLQTLRQTVATVVDERPSHVASPVTAVRTYRPSRTDGLLHIWLMNAMTVRT